MDLNNWFDGHWFENGLSLLANGIVRDHGNSNPRRHVALLCLPLGLRKERLKELFVVVLLEQKRLEKDLGVALQNVLLERRLEQVAVHHYVYKLQKDSKFR